MQSTFFISIFILHLKRRIKNYYSNFLSYSCYQLISVSSFPFKSNILIVFAIIIFHFQPKTSLHSPDYHFVGRRQIGGRVISLYFPILCRREMKCSISFRIRSSFTNGPSRIIFLEDEDMHMEEREKVFLSYCSSLAGSFGHEIFETICSLHKFKV